MKIVLILSISIYFKKTFRVNKYKKQICYKKHKPLFFFNMITDSFLLEKRGTLERARKCICKNLLYFDCQDRIRFNIYQVAYK